MNKDLSRIEISRKNILSNVESFKNYLNSETKMVAVVKANAYGHGLAEVAPVIENYVEYFQVDDLLELREIRKISNKKTLVLGYVSEKELEEAVVLNGILAIYDIERMGILNKIGKRLGVKPKIHIKIDALLGRQGILTKDLPKFLKDIKDYKNISIEGVYSHLSSVDINDHSHTNKQMGIFEKSYHMMKQAGYKNLITHISATAGVLENERGFGDSRLVRLGIGMYGMWPEKSFQKKYGKKINLKPAMRWVSHIAQVKTLPANHPIGYNLAFVTKKITKIAVIPQGYGDGYDRGFSNNCYILVRGKRCRVLGRVAMNMFVVDVSNVFGVKAEDEVVLLGSQGKEEISAEELAKRLGTINYEITTRVSPLLPRKIV